MAKTHEQRNKGMSDSRLEVDFVKTGQILESLQQRKARMVDSLELTVDEATLDRLAQSSQPEAKLVSEALLKLTAEK